MGGQIAVAVSVHARRARHMCCAVLGMAPMYVGAARGGLCAGCQHRLGEAAAALPQAVGSRCLALGQRWVTRSALQDACLMGAAP